MVFYYENYDKTMESLRNKTKKVSNIAERFDTFFIIKKQTPVCFYFLLKCNVYREVQNRT